MIRCWSGRGCIDDAAPRVRWFIFETAGTPKPVRAWHAMRRKRYDDGAGCGCFLRLMHARDAIAFGWRRWRHLRKFDRPGVAWASDAATSRRCGGCGDRMVNRGQN